MKRADSAKRARRPNTRGAGERIYAFRVEALRAGDILLSTVPLAATSIAIRVGTVSRFSHAAICTDPPFFVEAVSSGTRTFSIRRFGVRNPKWVAMLRLRDDLDNALQRAHAAAQRADTFILRHYWLDGALLALTKRLHARRRDELFCSHLVALAYRDGDFDLVPNVPPEKVSPGTLRRSKRLRVLARDDVLVATTLGDGAFELDLTDRHGRETLIDRETAIRRAVADRFESVLQQRRPDLLDEAALRRHGVVSLDKADRLHTYLAALAIAHRDDPVLARTIDQAFADAIIGEGYASIPDLLYDGASLEIDRFAALAVNERLWSAQRIADDAASCRAIESDLDRRIVEMRNYAYAYRETFRRTSLATFELFARTHERHLRFAEQARATIERTIAILDAALRAPTR